MRNLEDALTEKKYRAKMVKGKHGWIIKGMLFSSLMLGAVSINSMDVKADTWKANTAEEIATRLDISSGSYTFVKGDTYWEVGNVLNIKANVLMEMNGINEGEQYTIPVGHVVHWDGNHVTVKDAEGNTISDSIIKDEDKVDPNSTIAGQASDTPKTPVQTDANGNVIGNSNSNATTNNSSGTTNTNNGSNGNNNGNNSNNGNNGGSNTEKPNEGDNGNEEKPTPNPEKQKFTVSVLHKDEEGNILLKESDVTVDEDSIFEASAKTFIGYTLVGNPTQTATIKENTTITFNYKKTEIQPTPEKEKFDITIKYLDENGNELANTDTVKVEAGESYTATAKTIDGYTLRGEATQTVEVDGNKEITFTYTKNVEEVQKFKVTVNYVDEEGNLLDEDAAVEIEEGQVFSATAKEIDGYTLKGENVQTVKVEEDTTITFTYVKNVAPIQKFKVTVQHVDTEGNVLETESAVEVEENKTFTATAKEFNGYTLTDDATKTITVNGDTTITFNYIKDEVAPIVNKTELQNLYDTVKDTPKGNFTDTTWNSFQTALTNAKTVIDNANATQAQVDTVKNNLQTAFDNLEEKVVEAVKYNVTVQHVGSDGVVLETESAVEVEEGQTFTASAKTFDGYALSGETTQTITVNGDATITFNYTKNEVAPPTEDLTAIANQVAGSALGNVNAYRKSNNSSLVNLENNGALQSGTTTRAIELATLYDHNRPNGASFDTAVYEAGYSGFALNENIGRFTNTTLDFIKSDGANQLVNAWINSVGHANNMLNKGINEGAVGVHITKNDNGSYNLYFAFIGGVDESKPISGNRTRIVSKLEDGTVLNTNFLNVLADTFTPSVEQGLLTEANVNGEYVEVEPVSVPTIVYANETPSEYGYYNLEVTYRIKTTDNARMMAPDETEESVEESTVESTVESTTESVVENNVDETIVEETVESSEEIVVEEHTVESTTDVVQSVDKSNLIEAYDVSNTLSEENYNLSTWNAFMLAKADAKTAHDNVNASQVQVDTATTNLINAINNLA